MVMWADDIDNDDYTARLAKIDALVPGTTIIESGRW